MFEIAPQRPRKPQPCSGRPGFDDLQLGIQFITVALDDALIESKST
jgi:hypothetical protein